MHLYKTLVDLIEAPDHAPYDFLKLELCGGSFLFSVTSLLIRTGLVGIDDNSTHLLSKNHLAWREKPRDGSHLEANTIKEPFQVELFVNRALSFFKEMSVAFAGLTAVDEAHQKARRRDAYRLCEVTDDALDDVLSP